MIAKGPIITTLLLATLLVTATGAPAQSPSPAPRSDQAAISTPGAQRASVHDGREGAGDYVGVIFAYRTADVPAQLDGIIKRYLVHLGDQVSTGQVLAALDSQPIERDLAMAQASLRAARAEVARASVELDQARQILERRKQVAWALSKEDLEGLNAREQLAAADLEVARSKAVEQEAHVEKLQDDLGRCKISAPFPGRIGRIYRSEGARLTAGDPIARLVADTDLWVRFAVPPREAAWARPGKGAEVVFEENGRTIMARLEYVAPEVDSASGMIFMEARLDRTALDAMDARPGMVARVRPAGGG